MIAAADRLSPQTVEEMSRFFTDMIDAMHADALTTELRAPSSELRADDAQRAATPAPASHPGR